MTSKAVQPSLNRTVAIKVLPRDLASDPERVERFEREAKAVALLNHPNVVHIIDKDRDGDLLYFVMEYVPGSSLDHVLKARRLSLPEAFRVLKGVCRGLEAAHKASITHRDLNPRNILVSDDLSVVKLADFGISRVESISRIQGTLSTAEVSMGTLHYMAPEQVRDMASVDQRSDIYAVGVLLYEMLTGRLPLGRFSLPSQANNQVPAELDPIVLRCLAGNPAERYQTVAALLEAVHRVEDRLRIGLADELRGLSRSTSRMLTRGTRTIAGRRGAWLAVGAILLLSAVAAVGILAIGRWRTPATEDLAAPTPPAAESAQTAAEPLESASPAAPPAGGTEVPAAASPGQAQAAPSPPPVVAAPPAVAVQAPPQTSPSPAPPVASPPPRPSAAAAVPRPPPAAPSPSSPASADPAAAALAAARQQLSAGQTEAALAALQALVAAHGGTPAAADALLLAADTQQSAGRTDDAVASYGRFRAAFPRDPRAAEAGYRMGRLLAASGESEPARQAFHDVAAGFRDSPWAAKALAAKAAVEMQQDLSEADGRLGLTVPAALVSLRQLVETNPHVPEAEKAFWDLGEMYEKLKKPDLAADAFERLGTRFPDTRYDAWWRAAQIYDRKLDRPADAVTCYRQILPTSPHYQDAKKRIAKLTK